MSNKAIKASRARKAAVKEQKERFDRVRSRLTDSWCRFHPHRIDDPPPLEMQVRRVIEHAQECCGVVPKLKLIERIKIVLEVLGPLRNSIVDPDESDKSELLLAAEAFLKVLYAGAVGNFELITESLKNIRDVAIFLTDARPFEEDGKTKYVYPADQFFDWEPSRNLAYLLHGIRADFHPNNPKRIDVEEFEILSESEILETVSVYLPQLKKTQPTCGAHGVGINYGTVGTAKGGSVGNNGVGINKGKVNTAISGQAGGAHGVGINYGTVDTATSEDEQMAGSRGNIKRRYFSPPDHQQSSGVVLPISEPATMDKHEAENSTAELLESTPELDTRSVDWVKGGKKNEKEIGIGAQSQRDYRNPNNGGLVLLDGMLGKDKFGRVWRRNGTEKGHVYYLKSSIPKA